MVLNKRDLERAFSPKRILKKPANINVSGSGTKPKKNPQSSIKVCVRVRPLSEREQSQNFRNTIKVLDDELLVFDPKEETEDFFFHGKKQNIRDIAKKANKEMEFVFDRVFRSDANNLDVYSGTTKGIITTFLEGYNCSVFVYGATGAGKTHTMLGSKDNPGITCLTMNELFEEIENMKSTKNVDLGITYMEVYNESVHDLLKPCGPMHLREDANGGVTVAGMKVEKITSADRLFQLLQQGNSNRTQHPTDANAESSRSHAVFQVYLRIQNKAGEELKYCKLSMIDLAGSERGSATQCKGVRFKEGSNINKSLLALGNCINKLAAGDRHIPYRDSKLTRLLKDSLGGNCQTVMIANVSPSSFSYEDTYNTLKYATRAKCIKTQLMKNVMSVNHRVEHYVRMVEELKKENNALNELIQVLKTKQAQAEPIYIEKLDALCKEKKQIHTEWLNLEAQLNLLQWRIRWKTSRNKLKCQMAKHSAEYDRALKKNDKSLAQLEARANSIAEKMSELSLKKEKHNQDYNKFIQEIENGNMTKLLQTETQLRDVQCELAELHVQKTHHQKIIAMEEKLVEDQQAAIDFLARLCTEYHMILRGRNLITESMDSEYKEGMKKVEGTKAVTWLDMGSDIDSDEEEGVVSNSVRVKPYTNLSLGNLQSCSLPTIVLEKRPRPESTLVTESCVTVTSETSSDPVREDFHGTFVLESDEQVLPMSTVNKYKTTSFKMLKKPDRLIGSSRMFTPGPARHKGANKENGILKTPKPMATLSSKRPMTALSSRHVNIPDVNTPIIKVALPGSKMSREKERNKRNYNLYTRQIKLKRLGITTTRTDSKSPRF